MLSTAASSSKARRSGCTTQETASLALRPPILSTGNRRLFCSPVRLDGGAVLTNQYFPSRTKNLSFSVGSFGAHVTLEEFDRGLRDRRGRCFGHSLNIPICVLRSTEISTQHSGAYTAKCCLKFKPSGIGLFIRGRAVKYMLVGRKYYA